MFLKFSASKTSTKYVYFMTSHLEVILHHLSYDVASGMK